MELPVVPFQLIGKDVKVKAGECINNL